MGARDICLTVKLFVILAFMAVCGGCSASMTSPTAKHSTLNVVTIQAGPTDPNMAMACEARNEVALAYVSGGGRIPSVVLLEPSGAKFYINKAGAGIEVFDYVSGWCFDATGVTTGPEHRSVL